MPAEGKQAVIDWINAYTRGREDLAAAVDGNYRRSKIILATLKRR